MATPDESATAFRQGWNDAAPGDRLLIDMADGQTRVVDATGAAAATQGQALYVRRRYAISVKQARALLDLADMCAAMGTGSVDG